MGEKKAPPPSGVHAQHAHAYASVVDLGCAVRRLRCERSLTMETLAFNAGMHPTYLSAIEHGRRNPTWVKLTGLAKALDVPLTRIVEIAEQERVIALARARIEAGGRGV